MTRANDLIATNPELNLIDRNAPTLLGQLRPYMEWQKGRNEETNLNIVESLKEQVIQEILFHLLKQK